jgi:hypothetical protein
LNLQEQQGHSSGQWESWLHVGGSEAAETVVAARVARRIEEPMRTMVADIVQENGYVQRLGNKMCRDKERSPGGWTNGGL